MVRLEVLSGKKAGTAWVARRFPIRLGRSGESDFRAEEPGVWEDHAEIAADPTEGWIMQARADAPVRINGQPAQRAVLRNGDAIELGSLKLRFRLEGVRQKGLALRESLVWAILVGITLCQIALLWWLKRGT